MSHASTTQHDDSHVHVVPVKVLLAVWFALIVGTAATYAATWFDLGWLNIWIAIGIATAKASLVALFFMHLYWDKPFNGFVLVVSLLFVMLFLGLAMLDVHEYQPDVIQGPAPMMSQP
jgi:cytochrome c oxidase subunit 4